MPGGNQMRLQFIKASARKRGDSLANQVHVRSPDGCHRGGRSRYLTLATVTPGEITEQSTVD